MMKRIPNTLADPTMVLRIGGGICFLGHGILALTAKAGFMGLLNTFGLDQIQAVALLKIIGCLDILVGLSMLIKPNKRVLQWALVWTTLTVVAWGIHGDSIMDLARRATYITTPLALLYLLYKQEKAQDSAGNPGGFNPVDTPEQIASTPTSEMRIQAGEAAINRIDFSMICMKLMDPNEGEGWSRRQCAEVAEEYRRFLTLHLFFPGEDIVPNLAIDTFWHFHILDTAAYYKDCKAIFGKILHHYPYFGMKGKEDAKQFVSAFERTKNLYEKTFKLSMDGPEYLPSFSMRKSA